jgi:hypothetical protein
MAGLENKWKYVEFLVKECNFPVAYLEIILPYLRLYKLQDNVEQISRIIDSQTEGRIVANTESNTAEKCYEKIRNRMIKWLEERKENQVEIIDNSHALHKIKSHIKGGAMRPSFFRDGHILAWDCMCLAMENNDIELVEFILRLGYFRSLSLDAPLPIEYVKLIFDYGVLVYFTTCNTVDPQLVKSVKLAFKYHGGCQSSIFRLKFLYANQDVEGLLEFLLNYQSENWSLGNATALITLHLKNYSLFEPETAFDIMERILKIVSLSSGIVFPIDVLRTIWLLSYETGSGVILSGMFKKYFAFLKK